VIFFSKGFSNHPIFLTFSRASLADKPAVPNLSASADLTALKKIQFLSKNPVCRLNGIQVFTQKKTKFETNQIQTCKSFW